MESKDILMQVKEAIIRLEKLHKSIRVTVIGVARPTIWSILINEECIVELNNISMPGRLQMTTKLDGHRIRSLVKNKQTVNKKKPFTPWRQVENTLEKVCVSLSKSTIERHLHECKYRGFRTRCKQLMIQSTTSCVKHGVMT